MALLIKPIGLFSVSRRSSRDPLTTEFPCVRDNFRQTTRVGLLPDLREEIRAIVDEYENASVLDISHALMARNGLSGDAYFMLDKPQLRYVLDMKHVSSDGNTVLMSVSILQDSEER